MRRSRGPQVPCVSLDANASDDASLAIRHASSQEAPTRRRSPEDKGPAKEKEGDAGWASVQPRRVPSRRTSPFRPPSCRGRSGKVSGTISQRLFGKRVTAPPPAGWPSGEVSRRVIGQAVYSPATDVATQCAISRYLARDGWLMRQLAHVTSLCRRRRNTLDNLPASLRNAFLRF
ncbi:hypothetical protein PR048_016820 [Dryococelus australis]|uniref:Uncharacterized protein n=1 Tax=Dryococelus australis TaxID=614101 RepID=A0ABQ9H7R3_9NEOP|nr:hypothetical protein PR048_016820 [Dryococelus australis]